MKPEKLSESQLQILQHSLGVDQYGRGRQYRNRYAIGPDCDGFSDLVELCEMGFMLDHGPIGMWGGMHGFTVTDAGRRAMTAQSPNPPRLTRAQRRYQDYLSADNGMSFKEWLTRYMDHTEPVK